MDEKQLQVLWESFAKNSGGFDDYNEYKSLMGNANARKVFFDSYKTDIGFEDYTEFESLLGVGKPIEVSAQGLAGTSLKSVEPTQNIGQRGQPIQPQSGDLLSQSLANNQAYQQGQFAGQPDVTQQVSNPNEIGKQFSGGMQLMGTEIDPSNIHAAEDFKRKQDGMQRILVDIPYDDHTLGIEKQVEFELPAGAQVISPRLSDSDGQYMMQYIDEEGNRVNAMEILTIRPSQLQNRKKQLEQKPFDEWSDTDKLEYFGANVEEITGKITDEEKRRREIISEATGDREESKSPLSQAWDIAGGAVRSFGSGATRLGADLLGIPRFLNDAIAGVMGTPTWDETYGKTIIEKTQDFMRGAIDRDDLYNSVRFNNKGVVESFKDGDVSDGIAKLVMGTTNSLPMMLSLTSGNVGGLASTLSMGAGQYDELRDNKNMDQSAKMLNATLNMYAEMIPEKIGAEATFKPFYDLFRSQGREVAESALRDYMRKFAGQFGVLTPAAIEGIGEGATGTMNNLIAKYTGEDPNRKILQGVPDQIVMGAFSGGTISAPAQIANSIIDKSKRNEVQKLSEENAYYEQALQDPDFNDDERAVMTSKYLGNVNKINSYIEDQIEAKGNLTKKQQAIVEDLESRKERMTKILDNPNIPDSIKESTQSDIDNIDDQINDMLVTTKEPDLSQKTPAEIDENVIRAREVTPDLENAPIGEVEVPDAVFETLDKIGTTERLSDAEISSATESLYEKKKELRELKKDPERVHTIEEIDQAISGIDSDLESLNNYQGPVISETDFATVKPGDTFAEGEVKSSRIIEDGSIDVTMTDNTVLNSKNYATTEVQSESAQENIEVPMESPVEQKTKQAQELVTPTETEVVDVTESPVETIPQDETITETETVVPEAGQPDQNVVTETVEIEPTVDQNVQDEQTPVQEEIMSPEVVNEAETQTIPNEVQTENTIEENEPAPVPTETVQESTPTAKAKPKTAKGVLKGVSDRVAATGLARSVKLADSATISAELGVQGDNVNGYVNAEGDIVINQDKAGIDTPIHEVGHVWEQTVARDNPELHTRGMSLIQTEEGNPYVDFVRQTQPGLEGDALYKEALAQAIGDRGAKLIKSQKRGKIKEWLDAAWEYIGNLVGISGLTPDQIANLTLNQFADAAAVDLLSGKEFASLPNGDSVMKSDAEKASDLSASEKKIADFMERMRNKNNIKYQGTVPAGQLTPDEMKDFIDVVTELQKTGQVGNFSDLKEFASSVGITDIGQIRLAWNANNTPVGIKKGLLDAKTILDTDIEKMSREEWIALGKRMVDEGLVDADALVKDLVQYPRALQPYEVTALIYKKSLVEKEIDQLSTKTDVDSMALLDARLQMIKDFELITLNTAYQQGIALNLRAVMTDRDFNVVEILSDMRKQGDVSEEVRKRLESLGKELEIVKSDLRKRTAELESQKEKWEQEAINKTSGKPAVNVRENISRARKDALEVLDSINIADFGMAGMNFQMNGGIRFSIQPNNALIQAIESSLQFMRDNVSNGTLTLAEAVESAVDQVNQSVGKGKWDEMKFRSSILNSYVDKGHAPLAKKPYVSTDGSLVVPTQYLKDIVKTYRANNSGEMSIEQIVDAVSAEVGNGFDTREIRNAVTGYGRAVQNTITDDQRNINTARSIGKLLSELEDLEKLGPNPKSRNQRKMNERIVDLRKMIADLEDSMTSTPEEKAQMKQDKAAQAKKEYLKGYIDKIKKKIADGDFEPQTKVPKYDFSNDPEIIDLEKKREDIRNQFKAAKYEHELKNRTLKGKVFYWGEQVFFGLSRGVQAGADISSFLIQGGLVTFADPQRSIKALKTSVSKAGNSDAYHDYFHELQRDPFFEVARKAKLNMQLPNFYQNIVEEQLGGGNVLTWLWESGVDTVIKDKDLAKKFKDRFPFTAAERQYAMFLSDIRFNLFKTAATDAMNYLGVNADTKEGQAKLSEIAEAVNDITMASNIKSLEGATKVQKAVNLLFFSARKIAANFKILYKLPMYTSYYLANRGSRAFGRNDIANRTEFEAMIFQRLYGRYAGAGLGLMAASVLIPTLIANAAYDEDEEEIPLLYNPYILNPIHSDFMKLKIGDTRWSPFLGIEGAVGLIARLSTQSYMTSTSDQVREMGKRQGIQTNKTGFDIFSQFMRNKLAPTPAIISGIYGTEFEQRETSDRISKSFYPMWISGAMEEYETSNSLTRTLGTTALGLFGANFNTYGGAQFASAEGTDNKQAYNIMRKVGIADYTPDFRNKPMIEEGSLVDELSKSKMKKEYGPKYNEYMTAGVLAKKAIIQDPVTTLAAKESQVDNLKKEAYRYAELKTTGVIVDANFRQFTHEGVKYSLTKKQYKEKIKLIDQYMKEFVDSGYRADVRDLVIEKLDKDGIGRNPEYIKMRTDIQIWNEANSWSNEELSYNFTPGKYIPTTQYDERSDDYTED